MRKAPFCLESALAAKIVKFLAAIRPAIQCLCAAVLRVTPTLMPREPSNVTIVRLSVGTALCKSSAKIEYKAEKLRDPKIKLIQTQIHRGLGMNHLNPPEIHDRCWLSAICGVEAKRDLLSVRFSVASSTKCHQVLGSVIAQSTPRPNVMDLNILHSPARLTTPAISLQNFMAELAIGFWIKPQARPHSADPRQNVTCTSSRSCVLCGFGRPMTSRVRQGNKAFRLPTSKLTPARKSAQIISRQ
jgi:hypothetical protein